MWKKFSPWTTNFRKAPKAATKERSQVPKAATDKRYRNLLERVVALSGKNNKLKPGEVLFRVGDSSNGMYIIRKGQIHIYLDKGGTEITLATVGAGGMLGEMALFDKKPRSASARAVDEVELTQISNEDFTKILQQIPKWFVTLMATLSSRLRDTNERLQDLEAKYKGNLNPLEEIARTLHILHLLWFKIGVKEVKSWLLERDVAIDEVASILNVDRGKVNGVIDAAVAGGLLGASKNSYKKDVLTILNRGDLERFISFVGRLRKRNNVIKALPQEFVDILDMLARAAKATAYDTFSMDLRILEEEARLKGFRTENWSEYAIMLVEVDEAVLVTKTAKDINFKIQKKGIETFLQNARILRALTRLEDKKVAKSA